MTPQPHWRCQKCKQPMTGENGSVFVYNANEKLGPVGHYPIEPTPDEPTPRPGAVLAFHELPFPPSPNIGFGAYHHACDPFPGSSAYYLSEFPHTLERYIGWIMHLEEKIWMGRFDLMRMLGFWWTHKGERAPDLSH